MVRIASVVSLVWLVAAWGCASDGAVGVARSPILNGEANPGDPSIVYLLVGNGACTGSVIDPYVILTARHCLQGVSPSYVEVYTGANPSWGDGRQLAFAGDIFTSDVPDDDGDITILRSNVDLGVDPLPYSHDLTNPGTGDTIVAIGYGQGTDVGDEGPKRRGEGIVEEVFLDAFLTTAVTCFGDSGGPIFDQGGTIVGVVSAGTQNSCSAGQDLDVNVGYYADWLDGFVGLPDPDPEPDPDPVPDPEPDPVPDPDPVVGALGDPCTDASECASNACVTGGGYCTESCAGDSCPDGYECRGVSNEFYCVVQDDSGGGGGGRSGGCSAAGGPTGGAAVFAVLAALALPRRRHCRW